MAVFELPIVACAPDCGHTSARALHTTLERKLTRLPSGKNRYKILAGVPLDVIMQSALG